MRHGRVMTKDEFNAEMRRITGLSPSYGGSDEYTYGGRYYDWGGYDLNSRMSIDGVLARVLTALDSDDPVERVLAYQALGLARRFVRLPDDTWVVYSTYKNGWGGEGKTAVWSAHATEEEAKRWCEAWDAHWQKQDAWRESGTNYDTKYGPASDIPHGVAPHYLRRPDADPSEEIR